MRIKLLIFFTIFFTGCSTTYQSQGLSGGFTETALRSDFYKVTFAGNGFTSSDKTYDFAILRAAEIALKSNYSYMLITDSNNKITSTTTGGNTYVPSAYNQSGFAKGFAAGSGSMYPITVNKPSTTIYVRFLKNSDNNPQILDVEFIINTVKSKYDIK